MHCKLVSGTSFGLSDGVEPTWPLDPPLGIQPGVFTTQDQVIRKKTGRITSALSKAVFSLKVCQTQPALERAAVFICLPHNFVLARVDNGDVSDVIVKEQTAGD